MKNTENPIILKSYIYIIKVNRKGRNTHNPFRFNRRMSEQVMPKTCRGNP